MLHYLRSSASTVVRITLQHADRARTDPRNEATVQLGQPLTPKSHVRGAVGARVFGDIPLNMKAGSQSECRRNKQN
jgi:hypothetical protein